MIQRLEDMQLLIFVGDWQRNHNEPPNQQTAAEHLHTQPPTISYWARRLKALGYLVKNRYGLTLTDEGWNWYDANAAHVRALSAR